jgi:hypothetical protein
MRRVLLITLALTILPGTACKEVVDPGPQPDYTADTPEECIYNLELSFNTRDIALYESILSPNFTFYFNPTDVGSDVNGYVIPSSWGYEDDWISTDNMFTEAYEITMELPEGDVGDPPADATTYTASNISISLLVMIDADNGYIANKGTCEFTFEKVRNDDGVYWVIKDWRDFTYAKKGSESTSLGEIKAAFR